MSKAVIEKLEKEFEFFDDYKKRELTVDGVKVSILFIDSMADSKLVSEFIAKYVLESKAELTLDVLEQRVIVNAECKRINQHEDMKKTLLEGDALIFVGEEEAALAANAKGIEGRAIAEPPTSLVTKGPREGFTEDVKKNVMLLRKRLKTAHFKSEMLVVGKLTNTQIAVCYLDNVASKAVIDEVKKRIKNISIDGIIDSSYLSAFLCQEKSYMFNLVGNSEKPDVIASRVLEGRVAIVVDGSPIVLTVPFMLVEDLQTPDDYYNLPTTATFSRILRFFSILLALLLPALYVSMQLFNYEILPSKFLITIIVSSQGVPLSPILEMLVVTLFFDILREANARMPKIAGTAIGILGAIILGDAAVKAGMLSAPAVFIGALSGIGLYAVPNETMLYTLLRLGYILIGGIIGIFGILLLTIFLITYVVSLEDFGTPYFAPFAPAIKNDLKDSIIKKPLRRLKTRPKAICNENETRQGE